MSGIERFGRDHLKESEGFPEPRSVFEKKLPSIYGTKRELNPDFEPIYLSHGEIPQHPPGIEKLVDELYKSGELVEDLFHYGQTDMTSAENYLRERFGLGKNPHIVFSTEGSDGIIERLTNLLPIPPRIGRAYVLGPCFPNFVNFINQKYKSPEQTEEAVVVTPIETLLNSPANETLEMAIEFQKSRSRFKPSWYYLCLPTTPAGDVYDRSLLEDFLESCASHEDAVIIDAAFADLLEDAQSPISYANYFPNVAVTGTLSKGLGLPGLGVGYVVTSPNLKRAYNSVRRPLDYRQQFQLKMANRILSRDVVTEEFLNNTRREIFETKTAYMKALANAEFDYLHTDPRIPLITVDGKSEHFYDCTAQVSLEVADGAAFKVTHSRMTNRYIRSSMPPDIQQIPEIIHRLEMARELALRMES